MELYGASTAPTPNAVQVVAISSDDTSQSGIANVTITRGKYSRPASVQRVRGERRKASRCGLREAVLRLRPQPGSVVLIGGTSRRRPAIRRLPALRRYGGGRCPRQAAVSVQIQNPDGKKSNAVSLVVARQTVRRSDCAEQRGAHAAAKTSWCGADHRGSLRPGNDFDLDVAALARFRRRQFLHAGWQRDSIAAPGERNSTADICVFSQSGFDTSMAYTVSGPGDVAVISKQPRAGHYPPDASVPASARGGPSARRFSSRTQIWTRPRERRAEVQ